MNQHEFLRRVRQAAELGRAFRADMSVGEAATAGGAIGGPLCDRMAEEVRRAGGQALVADSWDEAGGRVKQILSDVAAREVLCWQHPALQQAAVVACLDELGVTTWDYGRLDQLHEAERRAIIMRADAGITGADLAIADTGTLVLLARPGQERVASLLPPVHVAVISEDQIVADLFEAFERLAVHADRPPSSIVLVTGPSKTGDIELQLTTGVHGPGQLHVLIVRCPRSSAEADHRQG